MLKLCKLFSTYLLINQINEFCLEMCIKQELDNLGLR